MSWLHKTMLRALCSYAIFCRNCSRQSRHSDGTVGHVDKIDWYYWGSAVRSHHKLADSHGYGFMVRHMHKNSMRANYLREREDWNSPPSFSILLIGVGIFVPAGQKVKDGLSRLSGTFSNWIAMSPNQHLWSIHRESALSSLLVINSSYRLPVQ